LPKTLRILGSLKFVHKYFADLYFPQKFCPQKVADSYFPQKLCPQKFADFLKFRNFF